MWDKIVKAAIFAVAVLAVVAIANRIPMIRGVVDGSTN